MISEALTDEVFAITADIFEALIDGEPGHLSLWEGPIEPFAQPLYAWVDMEGEDAARALLTTERTTADDLAHALLGMDPEEIVEEEDLVDAVGEVANVVGGNLKSMVPNPGALSLPVVQNDIPEVKGNTIFGEIQMNWKGSLLVISIWGLGTSTEGND
ncbi:MAG: chemotaxis protein CheX [Actinomycetaceae bacterium]|nr:chemotaxis protein CheX [Actinomycetaceae bacterium]